MSLSSVRLTVNRVGLRFFHSPFLPSLQGQSSTDILQKNELERIILESRESTASAQVPPAPTPSIYAPDSPVTGPCSHHIYIAVFREFGNRHSRWYRPPPAPAILERLLSSTPRQVYAEMRAVTDGNYRADKFKVLTAALRTFTYVEDYAAAYVTLRAFIELSASNYYRVKAKAVVLSALACQMYSERDASRRHLLQYLLGGISILDGEWQPGKSASPQQSLPATGAEDDLRPLAFMLRQALRRMVDLKTTWRRGDEQVAMDRALGEMEWPVIRARRERRKLMEERKREDKISWHST
ncbi:hypothetical protein B0H19DRAFT_1159162 [Mycena capillaripes]|nr:hypothetical protein B0H19DRAFT_1159162 [Mycena capillaripes]